MKKMEKFLLLEGVVSIGLAYFIFYLVKPDYLLELLYKPFEWIGNGLRWLSLSSSLGNAVAIILYAVISVSPLLYLLVRWRKKRMTKADVLLPIISVYTFYLLYHFINPGLMLQKTIQNIPGASLLPAIKYSYAVIFYSLSFAYLMLRVLGGLVTDIAEDRLQYLCKRLQAVLLAVSGLYVFFAGCFNTYEMLADLSNRAPVHTNFPVDGSLLMQQGNSLTNQLMVVITYLHQCFPVIFTVLILLSGIKLLSAMITHHMDEEEARAALRLSSVSRWTVYLTLLGDLLYNTVQFLLSSHLNDTNFTLNITLLPLVVAIFAMILSSYFKETKELQEENEMII